jgi:hypothetical protein
VHARARIEVEFRVVVDEVSGDDAMSHLTRWVLAAPLFQVLSRCRGSRCVLLALGFGYRSGVGCA